MGDHKPHLKQNTFFNTQNSLEMNILCSSVFKKKGISFSLQVW